MRRRKGFGAKRSFLGAGAALVLAVPASAHLLVRGIPLSELAATSPVAVIGRVASAPPGSSGPGVTLVVEEAVLGSVPRGSLRFTSEGHHPPEYRVGSRVLVFLKENGPPWVSRQTALDLLELPEPAAERDGLVAAVRAYAGLRRIAQPTERIGRLKTLALGHLASASERVRREALLDLLALAPRGTLDRADVARVAALAVRHETPPTLTPGLVALLASIPGPDAAPALALVLRSAASPQARALAAQAVGRRRDGDALPALRDALLDPAPEVRSTAERALAERALAESALEQIDPAAVRAALGPAGQDRR